jgi:hypothetical protein
MKIRAWIALAVGVVALVLSGSASAQAPTRTPLARAIELVDAHLAKARDEADSDLRRRLEIEGYLALLTLPGQHRPYEAADSLRRIDETLPERAGEDRRVITQGLQTARDLAELRSDLDRIVQIDRQYYDAILPAFIESYYFRRLARSNDAEAMTWFVRSETEDKTGVARVERIRELCAAGYRDLARHAALGLVEPEYDVALSPLLVDLGATKEAEQRADRLLSSKPPAAAAILGSLAVAAGRRGDLDEVARLIRKLGDAFGEVLFDPGRRSVPYGQGECAAVVLEPGFTTRWLERSIQWSAMEPLHGHSYPKRDEWPIVLGLAGAVAAAEASPRAVALIDELQRVFEKNLRDSGADLANMTILANRPVEHDTSSARFVAVSWLATRQGLRLARVAAGGEIDDAAARDLSLPWVMTFFSAFPNSSLSKRLATMSEAERRRIAEVNPRVLGPVQWVSMVLSGMGSEARALANAEPSVRSLDDWRLLHPIEMMENAGLRSRAVAALDAYVSVSPARDLAVQRLLMIQGQTDKAKAMAREFLASGSALYMAPEAFIGAMLLRELGDRTDVPSMVAMQDGLDAVNMARRLVAVVDALAWQPSDDEIRAAIGRTWPAFAQLSDEDAACLRATLTGVQAVGLARAGNLEAAVALVSGRTLEQRRFCGVGQGTDIFNPVFDIRFLVQEWVRRGHAAP